jgi:alpha-D-xyloside xylohydrolase
LIVYPGVDLESQLYEDDGRSFEYRNGAFMRIVMRWEDGSRTLGLSLAPGSRMIGTPVRAIEVRTAGSARTQSVRFTGTATAKL